MRHAAMRANGGVVRSGFTLIELLVVLVIIGLIAGFILTVALDGLRRGEERATQALIIKLESAVTDRLEALLTQSAPVNGGHRFLGSVVLNVNGVVQVLQGDQRSQVIARADLIRSELPETFFVQVDPATLTPTSNVYPLNFGGVAYPSRGAAASMPGLPPAMEPHAPYILPLGNVLPPFSPINYLADANFVGDGKVDAGTGIYGASYAVAAGLYKNLGYHPDGYDGVDNDGDGLIDEFSEGATDGAFATVVERLRNHVAHDGNVTITAKTARSEMLYALLVEGGGRLGSMFTRDQFTDREIRDTDDDGLPEFVDAWGTPIQFFRWPTHFTETPFVAPDAATNLDDLSAQANQKGYFPYVAGQPRQQSPLDPSQTLVAPAWWSATINNAALGPFAPVAAAGISGQALEFHRQFFAVVDPWLGTYPTNGTPRQLWDRSGSFGRRAFFCRPLILAAGPDRKFGVGMLGVRYLDVNDYSYLGSLELPTPDPAGVGGEVAVNALNLVLSENQAAPLDPTRSGPPLVVHQVDIRATNVNRYLLDAGLDDISNQNVLAPGGGTR